MNTIRGIPEHIEADFGDSIVIRDEALALLGNSPGLGPPDLCWLQKSQKRMLLGGNTEAQGYYHYVLGRDVSSSAAVAAYFALLNSKVEPLTMLQGLWLSSEYSIQRGFYCCYDPLSRMDLRCELCVPGGVVVGCVDAAGVLHDVTPQLWMQAQVCSFVRAVLYDPEMRLNGGSVITYEPVPTAAAEHSLLTAVYRLYSNDSLPGALQDIYAEQGCGVLPEQMDVVLAALWEHFRRRQRWQAAEEYFRRLACIYSPAALLVAAAARAQGISSVGHHTPGLLLSDVLLHHSNSTLPAASLVGLGTEVLESGQPVEAVHLARQALQLNHRCRPAWLLLAQCFIAQQQYAAALVALNVVPTPPLPAAEVELLHVVPPPPPKATTHPHSGLYDGDLACVKCCALEEASLDGSRLLAYLPGAVLINREPLGQAYVPDTSPNRITRSVLAAVYNLLQDIVAGTSWDAFLEVRSRVFLMQHEATPRSTPRATQELTGQQQQQRRHSSDTPVQHHSVSPAALHEKLVPRHPEIVPHHQQLLEQEHPVANGLHQVTQSHSPVGTPATVTPATVAAAGSGAAVRRSSTPPSRGQLSSGGGSSGHHRGSPKSYYASRLHEELAKRPSSAGRNKQQNASSSSTAAKPQHTRPQQQQQQSSEEAAAAVAELSPFAVSVPAAPREQQRSMAGRVLLLGKTQPKKGSKPGDAAGSSVGTSSAFASAAGVGCGVPRNLGPNEIEDLSRYASASRVAPLRTKVSITPELADMVFGASRRSPVPQATAATADKVAEPPPPQQQHDDAVSKAAASLPRIRTRPLGEGVEAGVEHQLHPASWHGYRDNSTATGGYRWSSASALGAECCNGYADSCIHPERQLATTQSSAARSRWSGFFGQPRQQQLQPKQHQHTLHELCEAHSSSSAGPISEGLDRTASLLTRLPSIANSTSAHTAAAGAPGSGRLGGLGVNGGYNLSTQLSSTSSGFGVSDAGGSGTFGASLARKASVTGEAVSRTLETDREGLISGWLSEDEAVEVLGADGAPGRRLCVRWLDELIVALWHDLQAYMEWKVWDQTLKEQRGASHAELVLGLVAESATPRTPVSDGGNLTPPTLTATDWMRRGALAERLRHVSDARAAYRASVKLHFNLTSYLALLRLEAQAGNASDTLLCAAQVLAWHQQRLAQLGGSSSGDVVVAGVPPDVVGWALGLVADSSSVDEVKQAAAAAAAPPEVIMKLDEWAKWHQIKVPIIE